MSDIHLDLYVQTQEAAEILGISPSTMRQWARQDRIRYLRNPQTGWRIYRAGDVYALRDSLQEAKR
ncbi:helix-turn-helix domain-containing protein [Allosalinactinospora lopnorensis]|uniref:helix-turn-helix domain-containing protein n=1 Tax=Allosalinactinospora lopnorensis TaxID=1352348 RepID=UPI000623D629|nr:helix-turn-helix domain-containing protein [Allosalinactinospora lopnorensis]